MVRFKGSPSLNVSPLRFSLHLNFPFEGVSRPFVLTHFYGRYW